MLSFESVGVVSSLYPEGNVFMGCDTDTYYRMLENGYSPPADLVAPERPTIMDGYKSRERFRNLKLSWRGYKIFENPHPGLIGKLVFEVLCFLRLLYMCCLLVFDVILFFLDCYILNIYVACLDDFENLTFYSNAYFLLIRLANEICGIICLMFAQ